MLALEPFGGLSHPPDLTVSGQARRLGGRQAERQAGHQAGRLELVWRLTGDLDALVLPDPSESRRRCDGLWQTTCLEAFWGFAGQDAYWELNLAPSGDWNLYRLSHYRGPLVPVALAAALPWQVRRTAGEWEVAVELDLSEVAGGDEPGVAGLPLEISLTAVIDQVGQGVSYWALAHTGAEPDFHRRDSFGLGLSAGGL
ncbi:MAG: DOMON-like domain-containing protein [Cyanobacteria bacterium]|nr:DOMON-like domain-containing protein [Cyanobacteriota bacterium]